MSVPMGMNQEENPESELIQKSALSPQQLVCTLLCISDETERFFPHFPLSLNHESDDTDSRGKPGKREHVRHIPKTGGKLISSNLRIVFNQLIKRVLFYYIFFATQMTPTTPVESLV